MIYKADKSLVETNPYLRDPKDRQTQFFTAVVTSSGIEGITITPADLRKSAPKRRAKKS